MTNIKSDTLKTKQTPLKKRSLLKLPLAILRRIKYLLIRVMHLFISPLLLLFELLAIPTLMLLCYIAKYKKKKIDIGLGPHPLINNIHHKKALIKYGYSAETFVFNTFFITQDFDLILDQKLGSLKNNLFFLKLGYIWLFLYSVFRYKCVYLYFVGGPLGITFKYFLPKLEPYFYKIANTKLLLMPYGGDVNNMIITPNLLYKYSMSEDYPSFKLHKKRTEQQVDRWTTYADHIISGCDWVYYMYHWDTLMLAHFSIDTEEWKPKIKSTETLDKKRPLKILHAPNHRAIKGTKHFIKAIKELREENHPIELILLENKHNSEIKKAIEEVDIVADQLIVGWYALFAIEAMSLGKPVICYLKEDFIELYEEADLIEENELPLLNCTKKNLKETLKKLILNRELISDIGKKSREFVIKHHSLERIGKTFDRINQKMDIFPQKN